MPAIWDCKKQVLKIPLVPMAHDGSNQVTSSPWWKQVAEMSVSRWRFSRLGMVQVVGKGQNSQSVCKVQVDDIPENLKDY